MFSQLTPGLVVALPKRPSDSSLPGQPANKGQGRVQLAKDVTNPQGLYRDLKQWGRGGGDTGVGAEDVIVA